MKTFTHTKISCYIFCSSFFILALQCLAQGTPGAGAGSGKPDDSVLKMIMKGGPIMIPLGICSIVALTIALERLLSVRRNKILPEGIVESLRNVSGDSDKKNLNELNETCEKNKSQLSRILLAGIDKLKAGKKDLVETTVTDIAAREVSRLNRSIRPLKVIAAISPLLGLLGTVLGMIRAFQTVAMSTAALGKAEKLAHGIYEAMITTAAGLSIAIPTLLVFYYLSSRIETYADEIEHSCNNFLYDFVPEERSKGK